MLHPGRLAIMLPRHPLHHTPTRQLVRLLILFLISTLIFTILFFRWDFLLRHAGAPFGIVSLELAWSVAGVERVIGGWTAAVQALALRITIYDYVYLLCYSTTLSLLCLLLSRWDAKNCPRCATFWEQAAWWPWIAAACDAIENTASLPLLLSNVRAPWPQIMTSAAVAKFLILGVVLILIFLSPLARLFSRTRAT